MSSHCAPWPSAPPSATASAASPMAPLSAPRSQVGAPAGPVSSERLEQGHRGHARSYEGRTLLQDSLSSRQTLYVLLSSRPSGWGCSENSSELNRWDLGHHGGVEAWDLGLLCSPGKSRSGVPEGSREMNGSRDEIWSQYLSVFLPFRHR